MLRTLPGERTRQTSRSPSSPTGALPPGPSGGRLGETVAFHRDPLGFLRSAQAQFGDVFTMRLATTGPQVVIADASAAKDVAQLDPGKASAGRARRGMLPMASPRSVFGSDGALHEAARRRVAAAFTPEAVAERLPGIARISANHVRSWPLGRPLRLLPRMRLLADEIFVREILGVADDARAVALARAIRHMLWTPGNPPLTIPGPEDGIVGRLVDAVYRRRWRRITALLSLELDERRRRRSEERGVLAMLVAAEPHEPTNALVEELMALLMAAQEPMAAALTWLALCAAPHPEAFERIAREGMQSDYGQALITETLRLHPSAVGMLRRLDSPALLAGHSLAAGTTVMAPIPLLQRDRRQFSDPDEFVPERHLRREDDRAPFEPFGGGSRRCLGESLACTELATAFDVIAECVRIRPLGPQPERMVLRATILVPQRSGLVSARAATARRARPCS